MASLTEEVYKEESIMDPVEYYVDAYKHQSRFTSKGRKAMKENKKNYNKYLNDYIRIYKKRKDNTKTDAELSDNFKAKINMEIKRRRDKTLSKEDRAAQKEERIYKRVFQSNIKDVLEKKTYGTIRQLKDSAKASKKPPSSMNLQKYKRKQADKLNNRYKKLMEQENVGPLPRQLVEKIGPSPLSSGASKTTVEGGGRKTRKTRKRRRRRTKKKRRRNRRKSKKNKRKSKRRR